MKPSIPELGTFVLNTHNPDILISISTVNTFNLKINAESLHLSCSFPDRSSFQPLTGYDAGSRIKIN